MHKQIQVLPLNIVLISVLADLCNIVYFFFFIKFWFIKWNKNMKDQIWFGNGQWNLGWWLQKVNSP